MSIIRNQYIPQIHFHPGETLAEKLEEMGMSSEELALRTGRPEKIINAVLNGRCAITADMAVQFEIVTQIPSYFWLDSQRYYDEYNARKDRKKFMEDALELQPMC